MYTNPKELSQREQEILSLVATGASNKEIARHLSISVNTVKVHLRNIFDKIGVNSRTEAAMVALNSGFVPGFPQKEDFVKLEQARTSDLQIDVPITQEAEIRLIKIKSVNKVIQAIIISSVVLIIVTLIYWRWRTENKLEPEGQKSASWEALASMPTARSGFAAVAYENVIFVFGGEDEDKVIGSVEKYDPENDRWTSLELMPVPVADVQAVEIGGKIYLPGGRLPSGETSDTLLIFDPNEDQWSTGDSLPVAAHAYALVDYEGKLYLFGGKNRKDFLSTIMVYDPDLDSWSNKKPMPTPRAYSGATVVGSKIYLLGGRNDKEALDYVEIYQPDIENNGSSPWSMVNQMPEKRYSMGIASLLEVIYLVGGKGEPETSMPMQGYLTSTGEWQIILQNEDEIWSDMALVALGNHIYAIGGRNDGEPRSELYFMQVVFISVLPFIP